jgi:hypothetical protein
LGIKKKRTRDKPLKANHLLAAYLNPTKSLSIVSLLFHCYALIFFIATISYIAIVGDLRPQVDLISSSKMTPLTPIQHLYIRDLVVSIKVFGKLLVEPKTLGWENSQKSFENLGVVSTPLNCLLNDFWDKWNWVMEGKKLVVYNGQWCFFVVARSNYPVQPHYPGMGRGLV